MALVLADRVQETTTTTGTGTITLAGAVTGYQSFAAIGNGNTTYYTITSGTAWEVGIGTYSTTGPTLARTTVLSSSAGGAKINLTGTSNVFVTYPSGRAVSATGSGLTNQVLLGTTGDAPVWGAVDLTAAVSGILPVANGGTGVNTLTTTRLLKGNGTSAVSASIVYDTGADVGIGGTPTTGFNLDVRDGTGAIATIRTINTGTAAGDNADIYIRTSATGVTATSSSLYFGDGDSGTVGFIQYTHTNDRMTFRTNGVNAFFLDSAGNGNLTGALTLGSALTVANGGTGLASGTSGGIPYFSSTTAMTSSGLLAANALMVGGGAGAAPSTITTGTGVVTALGVNVGSAGSFVTNGGALGTPSSGTVTNLTGTASININGTVGATTPAQGTFTNKITNTNDFYLQPSPSAQNATATLTIANLLTSIITSTSTTAVSLTLPTGTLSDAGVLGGAAANNTSFDWYLINLGSSSGAVTLLAGTGHTIVGNATVAISTSAHFRTRKTATNTFVTYRVS